MELAVAASRVFCRLKLCAHIHTWPEKGMTAVVI